MRIFVTGELGFIGRNLPRAFSALGHEVVDSKNVPARRIKTGEICVHRNSEDDWAKIFQDLECDLVVHNAAVVGTDVVALHSDEATLTNTTGTYRISRAAEKCGMPVCYVGTTVIYQSDLYQDTPIVEASVRGPVTLYGALKLSGEHIIKSHTSKWLIMRPLFAYGGVGDMNSLVAKTYYAAVNNIDNIDMFLDPSNTKDYMHVDDFCDAVAFACDVGLWCNDYNIAAETPKNTGDIVKIMSEICGEDLSSRVNWHPETDYLGNHVLSSEKFRNASGWLPKITLEAGLTDSWNSIKNNTLDSEYDPLKHLNDAKNRDIDLKQYY
jgi:nucleoside-diphosphate-sugar epimerase